MPKRPWSPSPEDDEDSNPFLDEDPPHRNNEKKESNSREEEDPPHRNDEKKKKQRLNDKGFSIRNVIIIIIIFCIFLKLMCLLKLYINF